MRTRERRLSGGAPGPRSPRLSAAAWAVAAALLFALPLWLGAALLAARAPGASGAVLAAAALGTLLFALAALAAASAYRRRIARPLREFQSALEDLAEGFLADAVPYDRLTGADQRIVAAFEQVLHINAMMSRTVDNLEQGFEEERLAKLRQEALTRAYERFVPHEFLSYLGKDSILDIRLGDHVETEFTILFSDIRSFTALSEQLSAEQNFSWLNAYLKRMEPVVKRHGGFIDKYIGDAVMALFPAEPDRALQAALDMLHELQSYNDERMRAGYQPVRIGVGLNSGPMMLGIVGGDSRMEGTVISDAVNVASRVEEMNKTYGTSILLTETVYRRLRQPERFAVRFLDNVTVKGKSMPIAVYEALIATTTD